MAVVELQFRERSFLDLVASEALRPPVASRVLDEVRRRNAEPQSARLRVTDVSWARPFLRARQPEWGVALVKVTLAVDLTGQSLRWDGAPVGPSVPTGCVASEAWIEVSVAGSGLCYRLAELRVVAPVATLPSASMPLLVSESPIRVDHGAIVVGGGVVSVRLATEAGDHVRGPVESRLDGHDWARLVPGSLLAEAVAGALDDALDSATEWPDAEVRVVDRPVGAWRAARRSPASPQVRVSARLAGVGALPFAFDLPFTLVAGTTFDVVPGPVHGASPMLAGSTAIVVEGDDNEAVSSFGALDLLRDELRSGLDGRLDSTRAGAVSVDDSGAAIRIETRHALSAPATRAWAGVVVLANLTSEGLAVRGILAFRQPGEIELRDRRGLDWARRHRCRPGSGSSGTSDALSII